MSCTAGKNLALPDTLRQNEPPKFLNETNYENATKQKIFSRKRQKITTIRM